MISQIFGIDESLSTYVTHVGLLTSVSSNVEAEGLKIQFTSFTINISSLDKKMYHASNHNLKLSNVKPYRL